MALDRIDFAILAALQNNARLSNKELAARAGLAPSSCLERVRTLQRAGVLEGHHTEVSAAALGIGLTSLVAVRLVKHAKETFRRLYSHLLSLPEVLAIFHVSGVNDLQVHVAVRDIDHLRDLIVEKFAGRPEVDHCETAVIFGLYRKHQWPMLRRALTPPSASRRRARARPRRSPCPPRPRWCPAPPRAAPGPRAVTSITAMSVTIRFTHRRPVSGSVHCSRILGVPSFAVCSIVTTTRLAPETRSIAPPMPFTIFPGIIQFARLPSRSTCSAPRIVRSTCPPRTIANESALEKYEVPGSSVTVSLPALMRSGSSCPGSG